MMQKHADSSRWRVQRRRARQLLFMVVCGVAYVVGVPGWGDTLPVLLKETPKPNYGVEVPTEISGRGTLRSDDCNTVGVANVSVTDGYHVCLLYTSPSPRDRG